MKIIISGASGLVGHELTTALRAEGHKVLRLVRSHESSSSDTIAWNPPSAQIDVPALEGADVVINLNGASIAGGRWTATRKAVLRSSRADSTRVLVDALGQLTNKPKVFLSASAVGYYGSRGDEILTEASGPGDDFLSSLARDWETEANRAATFGIHTVILRFGVVLAREGGALPQMVRPFRFGVGGRLGDGSQWLSWITIEDVVRIVKFVISDATISDTKLTGPINVVAPAPVQNAEFARVVAKILHRPAVVPAPAFALRLALGEMADSLLLASQRSYPEKLVRAGYSFRFGELESALHALLKS
jgi:uncharacterized protein (TIGR01777 family)